MKPRIKLTRIHQINGPDYWQADCYIMDHTLRTTGMTQAKAQAKMWEKIDSLLFRDWYTAHALNRLWGHHIHVWPKTMSEEYVKTQEQLLEIKSKPEPPPKKWSFWDWA